MDAANANAGAGADELLRERPHSPAPTRAKGPGRPPGPCKMSSSVDTLGYTFSVVGL